MPIEAVGIENASRIFTSAKHPKSFVSLAGADHLLSKKSDATYVADVIAAWAERYFEQSAERRDEQPEIGTVLVRETGGGKFQQEILSGSHRFLADEPVKVGGLDSGPGPYDLLLAGLGACTSMTLRLYADHKKLPLERVSVRLVHNRIHVEDCLNCETKEGIVDRIDRNITMEGPLDAEQRKRLLEIADKCPVRIGMIPVSGRCVPGAVWKLNLNGKLFSFKQRRFYANGDRIPAGANSFNIYRLPIKFEMADDCAVPEVEGLGDVGEVVGLGEGAVGFFQDETDLAEVQAVRVRAERPYPAGGHFPYCSSVTFSS